MGDSNNASLAETVILTTGGNLGLSLAPKSTSRFAFAAGRKESADPPTPVIPSHDPLLMDQIITPDKVDEPIGICDEREEVDSVPEKEILADWGGFLNTIPTPSRDPIEGGDILQTLNALGASDNKPHTSSSLNSLLSPATADTRDTYYNRPQGGPLFNDYYAKNNSIPGLLLFDIPPKVDPGKAWWYLDNQNILKGPFNAEEMETWYKRGYLKDDLLIRHGIDEEFYTVRDYMKDFKSFIPRKQSKSDLLKKVAAREFAPISFELTRVGSDSFSQDLMTDNKLNHSHSDRKDSYYSNMQSKHRAMSGGKSMPDTYDYDDKGKNKKKNKKRKIIRTISMQTGEDDIFVAEVKFVKIKKTTDSGCQTDDPNNEYPSFNSKPTPDYVPGYGAPILQDVHPVHQVHQVHPGHGVPHQSQFLNALFRAADTQSGGPTMMKPVGGPDGGYDHTSMHVPMNMNVPLKYQMMVPGEGGDGLAPCEEYVDEEQKYYEEENFTARRFKSQTFKGFQPTATAWNMEEDDKSNRSVSFAGPQFARPRTDFVKPQKRRSGYVNYEAVYSAKS